MTPHKNLIRLQAAKQEYDWGRQGNSSLCARLALNAIGHGIKIDDSTSYAEIWMGTHSHGPAHLYDDPTTSLLDLISSDPDFYLGESVHKKWPSSTQIPYLFKVLSIRKALPLQAHPDKRLAEQLQQKHPKYFVDPNYKPEIAIAIGEPLSVSRAKYRGEGEEDDPETAFTGFVGFRPLDEIKIFFELIPELTYAVGDTTLVTEFIKDPSKDLLKQMYSKLLKRGVDAREEVSMAITTLQDRATKNNFDLGFQNGRELAKLVVKINAQYPGDAGVMATVFFMNFAKLRKGEGIYIGADEVHAYLEGDIIECMAVSDNVVNAAFDSPELLAPQIDTFVNMLTYTARPLSHWALTAQRYSRAQYGRTVMYNPPIEEFVVLGTFLSAAKTKEEILGAVKGPTIGIVTRGKIRVSAASKKGKEQEEHLELDEGGVLFVPPGNEIQMEVVEGHGPERAGEVWWALYGA